jgi:2-oxoglutarate dehydrogenase E2 component (dihydrolipoamide succinyltransferase)
VAEPGAVVAIGGILAKISVGASVVPAAVVVSDAVAAPVTSAVSTDASYASGHPSPAASKILDEKGVSAADVAGTGVGGRITKEDALAAAKPASAPAMAVTPAVSAASASVASGSVASGSASVAPERTRREKMSSLRKTVARRLVAVKNETAMLTTFNEVDMKPVMDLRGKYKDKFKEKHGVGLGFMSFFTKAVCVALKEWPAVNAQIDGNEIVYNDFCDISIAVSAPKGLVVPVIRNAESMSFDQTFPKASTKI